MLTNYHTHTFRCKHASGEDREYVEAAIRGGMKVLGFSDHCPWIYEDNYVSDTRMEPDKLDDYFNSILSLKKEYASDITIYAGFEAEYIPELMEAQNRLLKDYPVDYMILGEHFLTREPYCSYMGIPTEEELVLKEYVDLVLEGMDTGKYCYVAHPDLINFTGSKEIYDRHMLRLCQYLKKKQIPVEINLLGVFEKRHYTSEHFLKLVQKTGNSIIIGVDAHTPERLENQKAQNMCLKLAEKFGLSITTELPGLGPLT